MSLMTRKRAMALSSQIPHLEDKERVHLATVDLRDLLISYIEVFDAFKKLHPAPWGKEDCVSCQLLTAYFERSK